MGFELDAFLGRTCELQKWKEHLPSATVCELSRELGMVPVTGRLLQELRASLGEEGVRRWGVRSSGNAAIAFISMGEFGDHSHEDATLWSHGVEILSHAKIAAVLHHYRDQVGLECSTQPSDLERYRGEDAAEKWVAATATTGNNQATRATGITEREIRGILVVRAAGRVDMQRHAELAQRMVALIGSAAAEGKSVVLDLSDLEYCDTGWGAAGLPALAAKAAGLAFAIVVPREPGMKVRFEICTLDRLAPCYLSVQAAVTGLGAKS